MICDPRTMRGANRLSNEITIPPESSNKEIPAYSCKVSLSNYTSKTIYAKMSNGFLQVLDPIFSDRLSGSIVIRKEYQWSRTVDILKDPVFSTPSEELTFRDTELRKLFLEEYNRKNILSKVTYEMTFTLDEINKNGGVIIVPEEHITLSTTETPSNILDVWDNSTPLNVSEDTVFYISSPEDDFNKFAYLYMKDTGDILIMENATTNCLPNGIYVKTNLGVAPSGYIEDSFLIAGSQKELNDIIRIFTHTEVDEDGNANKFIRDFVDTSINEVERKAKRSDVEFNMAVTDHKLGANVVTHNIKTLVDREALSTASIINDMKTSASAIDSVAKVTKAIVK